MDDDAILLATARDRLRQCEDAGVLTHTLFLSPHARAMLESLRRESGREVRLFFFGGYPDAERTAAVFLPACFGVQTQEELAAFLEEMGEDSPFCLIRAQKDAFSELTHRDYLGALMGLGVKREMLGDILVHPDGCDLIALRRVAPFLHENLTGAGRAALRTQCLPLSALRAPDIRTQEEFCSVASLRADTVAAAAFHLSRGGAADAIRQGLLLIDGVPAAQPDRSVEPGSRLTLRGHGRVLLREVQGETRKGRLRLLLERGA